MRFLKQNTATNLMVYMSDSLDHTSGKAGLTLVITASKDGSTFNSIAPIITDLGNGWYNLSLTEAMADTLGDLAFHITAAGADATDFLCRVVAGSLDADITSRLSGAGYTPPDNSGIASIKAKTDNLPSDPASNTQVNTRLSAADYTTPDNSTIELIKTKVDSLENYDDTSINVLLDYIRKITGNKIIRVGNTITIYEDDGTTIWKQYDVSNLGRIEI